MSVRTADAVVVTVSADQAAVEADVRHLCRRHHFKLGGEEILLGHTVFFIEKLENVELDKLAALVGLERKRTDDNVQLFALDSVVKISLVLLL